VIIPRTKEEMNRGERGERSERNIEQGIMNEEYEGGFSMFDVQCVNVQVRYVRERTNTSSGDCFASLAMTEREEYRTRNKE
jgi:hypothetical protein